jgi:glycosyltransferase involved in cell wall biosynthesis
MLQQTITADIIIPQYRDIKMLNRCLESLANIDMPDEIQHIWVVENGGIYGAREVQDKYQDRLPLKYIYQKEGSLSNARNAAAKQSTSDILIFFDNDLKFYPETLTSYVAAFKENPEASFFGGPLEPDYEKAPDKKLERYLPKSAIGYSLGGVNFEIFTPDFLGGNHAVYKDTLLEFGGYDPYGAIGENKGAVGEETRLMEKLLAANLKGVYVAGAKVLHYVPEQNCTAKWILKRSYRHGYTDAQGEDTAIGKKLMGVPLYYFRHLFSHLIKMPTFNKASRFKALYSSYYQFGKVIGKLKK